MIFSSKQARFQQLTHPWRDRLFGVALRQVSSSHIAEDWVQETFLRAWRNFSQLSDEVVVYAWLLKILDHVIIDDKRRDKRRYQLAPVIAVDDQDFLKHPCSKPGPFENALNHQRNEQILAAIKNLPEEFQRVVLYRDIEGPSYKEVAYILDIPRGTVMSRLSRGRRLLAKSLMKFSKTGVTELSQKEDSGVSQ